MYAATDQQAAPDPQELAHALEQRFKLLVEYVGDAVFLLDVQGRIETWTPAARRILGFTAEEIVGREPGVLYPVDVAATVTADLREAVAAGRHEVDDWRLRKDGTRFWAHVVTCPIPDAAGGLSGYAQIIRDLTKGREADEAQHRYALALERSNRELESFASIASHDLQEPLRKILAFGDRLKTSCAQSLDDKGREYLDRIGEATKRMQRLVDDLLAYSRLAGSTDFQPTNLADVVRDVLSDLESSIESAGATVELNALPVIEADAMQMRQLFQNLLGNALKFRSAGNPPHIVISSRCLPATFALSGAPQPPRWEIQIRDNGIGFDEKYLERIFGMLQRLHGRLEYEGTGMGLAICRKIVERHDGSITAQSSPGEGATFIATLPATQARGTTVNS